jgi:branched-chain amino acid transport system ATP-binding protein
MPPEIMVENLTKRYGGVVALDNLSFQVDHGETLGIIGPNGAGKTTLFDLITGFQRATSGRVLLNGRDITGISPHRIVQSGMNRTFQIARPFKDLTVLESVLVGLIQGKGRLKGGRTRAGLRKEAVELLQLVNLTRSSLSLTRNLSQGELKKLELARALSTYPDVLLVDEVFSGLSAQETNELSDAIVRVKASRNLTLLMVEHKVSKVVQLANRMLVLDYGKLLAQGTPQEILRDQKVLEAYLGKG